MGDTFKDGTTDWHNWMRDTMQIEPSDSKSIALVWAVIGRMKADEMYKEPSHEPSAEDCVDEIVRLYESHSIQNAVELLESAFTRQREKGRQEAFEKLERNDSTYQKWLEGKIAKRYAALEEAARKRIDVSCKTCDWKHNCHGCAYSAIRKALRELEGRRKG